MNKKRKIIFTLVFISIFTMLIFKFPMINKDPLKIKKNEIANHPEEEPIKKDPVDLKNLKTASPSQDSQNFSFNPLLQEIANLTWNYENYNVSQGLWPQDFMLQWFTNGYNVTLNFYINDLTNASSPTKDLINPSDLTNFRLQNLAGQPAGLVDVDTIADDGLGKGSCSGFVRLNKTLGSYGVFALAYDYDGYTNITYNATMKFNVITNHTVSATFKPDLENTQSDFITWEINYDNYYTLSHDPDDYKAVINLEGHFTLSSAIARDDTFWRPINSSRTDTNLTIYGTFDEYKIQLNSPNYVSVIYNENLTIPGDNDLNLYVTCKMAGDLSIEFTDVYGDLYTNKIPVQKDDTIFFNYTMSANSSGGISFLNITLTNSSKTSFGVKYAEIMFYKDAFVWGGTGNTTAFSQLWVLAPFIDTYRWDDILTRNNTQKLNLTIFDAINYSIIHDAVVTYEIAGISGELEESIVPINETGVVQNVSLYFKIIDLREFLISPGTYNLTITASKTGYTFTKFVTEIIIFKQDVYIDVQITPSDNIFTIEESFAITINLHILWPYYENFLRVPVNISVLILKNGTIEDDHFILLNAVQSYSLQGIMGNDSLPGEYTLNISIISKYYTGNVSINVKVVRKELDITLNYESTVDEDEEFDITWDLEHGNFTGNRENMTMEIYLDGVLYSVVKLNATNSSSGAIRFELDDGDHTIIYRLISPFYAAVRTITIEAEKGSSKPKEVSWIEENWPFLLLLILAVIAMSIFGVYMTVSRRKVKAQRELESELVALKTKYAATEKNISLIETQISQIAGIYWILIIHAEQGVTMVEITDFMFDKVLSQEYQQLAEQGVIRDSALIGGFLTAIRNFSRETSDTETEHQAVFNSQTDYSTVVNDKEVHRRILEGSNYFMAFISARGTTEISDVLGAINSIFNDDYGEAVKSFLGRISVFDPFKVESVAYLHNMIIEMQKKLEDEKLMLEHYQRHVKQVQDKIGIKKNK